MLIAIEHLKNSDIFDKFHKKFVSHKQSTIELEYALLNKSNIDNTDIIAMDDNNNHRIQASIGKVDEKQSQTAIADGNGLQISEIKVPTINLNDNIPLLQSNNMSNC